MMYDLLYVRRKMDAGLEPTPKEKLEKLKTWHIHTLRSTLNAARTALPEAPLKESGSLDPFEEYRQLRAPFLRELNHLEEKVEELNKTWEGHICEESNPPLELLEEITETVDYHSPKLSAYCLALWSVNPAEKTPTNDIIAKGYIHNTREGILKTQKENKGLTL